ncbi:MAG: hypothetical protein ACK5MA_10735 [Parachlamydiaceae bacterium]
MLAFLISVLFFGGLAAGEALPYPISTSPQLPLEVYEDEFKEILGVKPELVHLADGFGFTEGPVYIGLEGSEEGYLLFTDQINDNILMPKETANLTFGGEENNILFICSSNSVWAIKLNAQGAKPVPIISGRP